MIYESRYRFEVPRVTTIDDGRSNAKTAITAVNSEGGKRREKQKAPRSNHFFEDSLRRLSRAQRTEAWQDMAGFSAIFNTIANLRSIIS